MKSNDEPGNNGGIVLSIPTLIFLLTAFGLGGGGAAQFVGEKTSSSACQVDPTIHARLIELEAWKSLMVNQPLPTPLPDRYTNTTALRDWEAQRQRDREQDTRMRENERERNP